MKNLISIIVLASLIGCIRDNPKIKIQNKSSVKLDSVIVYATSQDKTVFKNIEIREKKQGIISFKNVPKTDGGYLIQVFKDGNLIKENGFGYYTNGGSLNYGFNIMIKNDTILIDYK
ncbi:hypothetical protein Lupro_02835 [Lutibacter profundi]|uniref:Uncharacterized protein n=1 Tax=Lutibacter profundi TaxID=1622118 RepID=A0A109RN35_9FLAO|nr:MULTISPECIES: hypothetical protein [Lutibacter]AMC10252.1 hypothetical protein Lupro_02835 [Lutibacter profundi]MCF6169056.1 hypothetical protein [Lutibacter sp.]